MEKKNNNNNKTEVKREERRRYTVDGTTCYNEIVVGKTGEEQPG